MKETELEILIQKAKDVSRNAYAPYSKFPVGAAIQMQDGTIFTGCNVENATYGLTTCAERNAIANMISSAQKDIKTIVIYTPTKVPTVSCGACRQVIKEFTKDAKLISVCDGEGVLETTIDELLPNAFSGQDTLLGEGNK